ncbi:hypothetical protein SGRI78S_00326 [Streptomyces griseus subsp. griseus]
MPTKCGARRSPPVVDQPVSGMAGPPSGTPTECAPMTSAVSRFLAARWPSLGPPIRKPRPAPARAISRPPRTARAVARSAMRLRSSRTAITRVAAHRTATVCPIALHSAVSKGVAVLKWLRRPRTTCTVIRTISVRLVSTTTWPAHRPVRCPRVSRVSIQARVMQYATKDTANLNGFAQIGAPTRTRSSTTRPTADTRAMTAIAAEKITNGRCQERHDDMRDPL